MTGIGPAIPVLRMFDEAAARAFWSGWLGATVAWEHRFAPELPLYMEIRLGDVAIHLTGHHGDCTPGSLVRIAVEDVERIAADLAARPYDRLRPAIQTMPWGLRELALVDPAGNRVIFFAPERVGRTSGEPEAPAERPPGGQPT